MKTKELSTKEAPAAVGAYSQGQVAGDLIFTSGQIGLDPETNRPIRNNIEAETRQVLENLINVVKAGGGNKNSIVKTTVYVTDLDNYQLINEIYESIFQDSLPARSVVEVADLPKEMNLEIEAIATKA